MTASLWARRVLVAGVAIGLGACSRGCGCGSRSARNALKSDAATSSDPRVEIVSTGREPRAKLEVARFTGYSYRMRIENEGSVAAPGQPPVFGPKAIATISVQTVRGMSQPIVRSRGGRELRLIEERLVLDGSRVESPTTPKDALSKLNEGLKALVGTTARQLIAEDGEIAEMTTELVGGKTPTPDVKHTLDTAWDVQRRFPFRLPHEPVGPGARWRFSEPIEFQGIRAMQAAEMTLTALDERVAKIRIVVRHQAPRQEVPHPFDPRDTATLEQYRGDGDGELVIDRSTAILLEARLTTTATMRMSGNVNGAMQTVTLIAAGITRFAAEAQSSDAGADAH